MCSGRHPGADRGGHRERCNQRASDHDDTPHRRQPGAACRINRDAGEPGQGRVLELPGLHLTSWQAQRLWGLDEVQCDAILDALVQAAFLRRTVKGAYARLS